MAKKRANGKITKTQLIQDLYNQGVTSGKDIAKRLEESGTKTSLTMVYSTISAFRKAGGASKQKRAPRQVKAESQAAPAQNGSGSLTPDDLVALVELAKRAGGIQRLRAFVDSLAQLSQ
jgi:hypothetical protein